MAQTLFNQKITDISKTRKDVLGDTRFENGRAYKYVRYEGGTAALDLVSGDMLHYVLPDTADANEQFTVSADRSDISGTGVVPIPAGMALAIVDISADKDADGYVYMWIQIKGFATLSLDPVAGTTVTAVDGRAIKIDFDSAGAGTGDKKVQVAEVDSTTAVDALIATNLLCGSIYDFSTKQVILDCPF